MTWKNGHEYCGSRDIIDRLVGLVDRQPEPDEAGLDVLRRLAEKLGVEVVVIPPKDSPVTVTEIEAVAEVLVDLLERGLVDDDLCDSVEVVRADTRDRLDDLGDSYQEWTR